MKTFYCILRCTAFGGCCWLTAILFSQIRCWWVGCQWGFLLVFLFLPLLFLSLSHLYLFSYSLMIIISVFPLVFLYFCFFFISSFSLFHFVPRRPSLCDTAESHVPCAKDTSITIGRATQSTGIMYILLCFIVCIYYNNT